MKQSLPILAAILIVGSSPSIAHSAASRPSIESLVSTLRNLPRHTSFRKVNSCMKTLIKIDPRNAFKYFVHGSIAVGARTEVVRLSSRAILAVHRSHLSSGRKAVITRKILTAFQENDICKCAPPGAVVPTPSPTP